jgi:flagellar hook-length control protein FliK
MNATPANLNPVNAIQPAASGKQQDSAAPDVPFSQVLSSEIAQNQRGREAKEDPDAKADTTAAAAQSGDSAEAAKSSTAATAPTARTAKADKDKEATELLDPLLADTAGATPNVIALAVQPDLKTVPAGTDGAATEQTAAAGADVLVALGKNAPDATDSRKGRATPAPQAASASVQADAKAAADTQKTDSPLPKADFQAAVAAAAPGTPSASAMAAATAGQAATERQSDAAKITERVSDLMNSPAFRPAPHAPLDAANIAPVIDNPAANRLAPSVGTTAWAQALGEKIVWMAAGAQQTASLTLNPPNLGPMQVVLHVSNDQATASFFSAQPEVRQALETAFPRLREMMNDAGIQLGEATVSADTPRQNDTPERQAQRGAPFIPPFIGGNDAVSSGLQTVQGTALQSGRGLIDTFA